MSPANDAQQTPGRLPNATPGIDTSSTEDDTLIGGSGADRFRLSKGDDIIKDFSIADDDQLLISNATNLTIEQVGSNLLLTDADKDISTTLKGVALDDLLAHQPQLLG